MATATIIGAWRDGASAWASFRVDGDTPNLAGDGTAAVEYTVFTPLLKPDGTAKSNAELKADLTAAAKALRDQQRAGRQNVALSGTVTL